MAATGSTKLEALLNAYLRRYRANRLLCGLGFTALLLLLPLPAACLLDRYMLMPDFLRIAMWSLYCIAAACALIVWILVPLTRRHTLLQAAFSLGDQRPELNGSLPAALQLAALPSPEFGSSTALVRSACEQAERHASELEVRQLLPRRRAWTLGGLGLAALALNIPFFFIAELHYSRLLARFFNPFGNYARVSGIDVAVTPASADLGDGERLTVEAETSDPELAHLGLMLESSGGKCERFEMSRFAPGRFVFTLTNSRNDFSYFLEEGLVRTESYRVRVQRRPRLERFQIRYEYPTYTSWPAKTEEKLDGNLEALTGTRVSLRVELDTDVRQVVLRRRDGDAYHDESMALSGGRAASLEWKLEQTFEYQIIATGHLESITNLNPLTFTAKALPDQPPLVVVQQPAANLKPGARSTLAVRYEARDEFAIQDVRLLVRRAGRADERRALVAQPAGGTLVHGSGSLCLAEIKALPGEAIQIAVEARDVLGQWGCSPVRMLEIPVASGDPAAVRQADDVAPVRAALSGLQRQLSSTHAILERLRSLLTPPPNKWTPELQNVLEPLRPSVEALCQKTGLLAGVAIRQREEGMDARTRYELLPVVTLSVNLDQAARHMGLEQLLIDIRQGFQERGPEQAAQTAREVKGWLDSTSAMVQMLSAYERHLRTKDLSERARELLEAQQGLLLAGQDDSGEAARARDLQRIVLEETRGLLQGIASVAEIEPRSRKLAADGFTALIKSIDEMSTSQATGLDPSIGSVSTFVAQLAGVFKHLEFQERESEALVTKLRDELVTIRDQQVAVTTLLQRLSDGVAAACKAIKEDPLDKEDELERLTPWVVGLRRTLDALPQTAGECWTRADAAEGTWDSNRRLDLARIAYRLHHLDCEAGSSLRRLSATIAATFETPASATPLLKDMRKELDALRQRLLSMQASAQTLDEESRLHAWAQELTEGLPAVTEVRGRAGKETAMPAVFESPLAELKALAADAVNPQSFRPVATWQRVLQALDAGVPSLQASRAALSVSPEARYAETERQTAVWRSIATDSNVRDLAPATSKARQALGDLRCLMSLLAAEPACQLASENMDAVRRERAAFLALWVIHQEAAFQALTALDACAAEENEEARQMLHAKALAFSAEAARRLEEFGRKDNRERALLEADAQLNRDIRNATQLMNISKQAGKSGIALLQGGTPIAAVQTELTGLAAAVLPFGIKGDEAARKELETLIQDLSTRASEQADLDRKMQQAGRSEQRLETAYRDLAMGMPERVERLVKDLQAAQAPAQRFGTEVSQAIQDMADGLKRAQEPARQFAATSKMTAGQAFNQTLALKSGVPDMDGLLDQRIARQNARSGDAEVLAKHCATLQSAFGKLDEIKARYAKCEAERCAAYDDLLAEARKAYHLLFHKPHLELFMKYTPPPSGHSDNTKTFAQRVDEYVASAGWSGHESYRSPLFFLGAASIHDVTGEKASRIWMPPFGATKKRRPVPDFWDGIAGCAEQVAGLVDGFLKTAQANAPGDVEALNKFKADFLKARDILGEAVSKFKNPLTTSTWKKTRNDFASELAALAKSIQPAVDALAARAVQRGWQRPKFDPAPVAKRGNGRLEPPQMTLETAAYFALALLNELRSVGAYDLLGGADDPNFDLKRAQELQEQVPPSGVLDSAARIASSLNDISVHLQKEYGAQEQLDRELKALESERAALSKVTSRYRDLGAREAVLRSALVTTAEGKGAVLQRFFKALDELPPGLAVLRLRLERLMETAPLLHSAAGSLKEAFSLLAQEFWARGASELKKAIETGRRDDASAMAAAHAEKLDRLTGLLRAAQDHHEQKTETASAEFIQLASASARGLAGEAWPRLADLQLKLASSQTPDDLLALECLKLSQDLRRAAELELEAAGGALVENAGRKESLALQALIKSVSQSVATTGLNGQGGQPGLQVLGKLQLRPAGQDPAGLLYGQLPMLLRLDLNAVSHEKRPPELESAWTRYVHSLLNPPRPQPNLQSSKGGAP